MVAVWPEFQDASSDGRNHTSEATSSGRPKRLSGCVAATSSSRASYRAPAILVFTTAGATALIRIAGASSTASSVVTRDNIAVVAPYQPMPHCPNIEKADDVAELLLAFFDRTS